MRFAAFCEVLEIETNQVKVLCYNPKLKRKEPENCIAHNFELSNEAKESRLNVKRIKQNPPQKIKLNFLLTCSKDVDTSRCLFFRAANYCERCLGSRRAKCSNCKTINPFIFCYNKSIEPYICHSLPYDIAMRVTSLPMKNFESIPFHISHIQFLVSKLLSNRTASYEFKHLDESLINDIYCNIYHADTIQYGDFLFDTEIMKGKVNTFLPMLLFKFLYFLVGRVYIKACDTIDLLNYCLKRYLLDYREEINHLHHTPIGEDFDVTVINSCSIFHVLVAMYNVKRLKYYILLALILRRKTKQWNMKIPRPIISLILNFFFPCYMKNDIPVYSDLYQYRKFAFMNSKFEIISKVTPFN